MTTRPEPPDVDDKPRNSEAPDWAHEPQNPPRRDKATLKYHQIKCAICNHPERDAIEEAFLDWVRPGELAREFNLGHRTVVYRHAHALGLFKKRAHNARFALGLLLEQSDVVKPTGNEIIRAVRAFSCIDEYGKWTDPPRHLIVTHLDAKGAEISPNKLDPAWQLGRHPSEPMPRVEESLAARAHLNDEKSIATQISQANP
ncbi:MAG TPA: hypothetical protein VJW93_06915 [Candidatus Acidoferrales bacterium]|nr:hypothetical protein [Candidatus Acidoferrales bacterium]